MAATYDDFELSFVRGDPFAFTVRVRKKDSHGIWQETPIGNWQKFWFTAKRRANDTDAQAVIAVTDAFGDRILRTDPDHGACTVSLLPIHTQALVGMSNDLVLLGDVQGLDSDGLPHTVALGHLTIRPDITIRTI